MVSANHGNIGGGYSGDLLVQAPLRWLKNKAETRAAFRYDVELDAEAHTSNILRTHTLTSMRGAYRFVSKRYYRTIGSAPIKDERGTHSVINETIDVSVFDRWRASSKYRPNN